MSGSDELAAFVQEALSRKLAREDVHQALTKAGWQEEQIRDALRRYADVDFPIPVPRPRAYLSAREAFLYLVMFCTLYVSAFQLGSLLFQVIDRTFPDEIASRQAEEYARSAMRWSVSGLIVAFPVFVFMSSLIAREVARDPVKRSSTIRKRLTFVTLFIAALVLIGDVTTVVYNALGGELTTRFLLKVLTVAVIAGTTFGYYLWDVRQDDPEPRS